MTNQIDKLLEQARLLSPEDRLRLAEQILSEMDGAADVGAEAAWLAEIDRRSMDVADGKVRPVPWSEVREGLRRRSLGD